MSETTSAPPTSDLPSISGMVDLSGRVALVTGGGRGFGYACVSRLSEAGAVVMIADYNEMEKLMDKIAAKYGGKEKLKAKYGKELPPAIRDEFKAESMKARMSLMHKQMPLQQKYVQGITFYIMLKPENDPHYAGGGVKLGTPDRPILWYKPTDAEKYHVIFADLSVKEVAPEELEGFPESSGP